MKLVLHVLSVIIISWQCSIETESFAHHSRAMRRTAYYFFMPEPDDPNEAELPLFTVNQTVDALGKVRKNITWLPRCIIALFEVWFHASPLLRSTLSECAHRLTRPSPS